MDKDSIIETTTKKDSEEPIYNESTKDELDNKENSEMEKYVNMINVFIMYYQQLYKKKESMFENVDMKNDISTNRQMELLYEYVKEYNDNQKMNPELADIYDIDDINQDEYEILYLLLINDTITKISPCMLSLLYYISDMENWQTINWKITTITKNT